MQAVLDTILTADPAGVVPLHAVLAAVRTALPASARLRRDEIVGLLSAAGYKMPFLNGQLHVAGCRLI